MTGENKPPAYNTREDLEDRNATWVYGDTPQTEDGSGTEAEARPNILDLEEAKNAAMMDASPAAHRQGLIEEATLDTLRVFAAGGFLAGWGREHLEPQTRAEPTYDSADFGIFGHDDEFEKQQAIMFENTKLDSDGVPLADGKIATMYTDIAKQHAEEEKRRREQEERMAAYLTAEAIANNWWMPTMTFEEFEHETQRVTQQADTVIHQAQQTSSKLRDYIQENREHSSRIQDMEAQARRQQELLTQRLQSTTDPTERDALQRRIDAAGQTVDAMHHGHVEVEQRGRLLGNLLRANELDIQRATQGKADALQGLENLRNMTPEQAKAQALSELRERLEYERAHVRAGHVHEGEDHAQTIHDLETRISDLESGKADPRQAYQAMLEGRLHHFDEQLQQLQTKSMAVDNAVDAYRRYQSATEAYSQYMLEIQQTEHPTPEQLQREADLRKELQDSEAAVDQQLQYLNEQSRRSAQQNRTEAASADTTVAQAAAADATGHAHEEAAASGEDLFKIQTEQHIRMHLAGAAATEMAAERSGGRLPALTDQADPTLGGRHGPRAPASAEQIDSSVSRVVEIFSQAKTEGRAVTEDEWRELGRLPGMSWHAMRETAEEMGIDAPSREQMMSSRPDGARWGAADGASWRGTSGSSGVSVTPAVLDASTDAVSLTPASYDYSSFGDLGVQDYSLFGYSPYSSTRIPYSPIQPIGYSGSPLVQNDYGISGGGYRSFADNEFNETNPTLEETGGAVPSYNKPWYESAWDSITNLWKSDTETTPSPDGQLGQAPTMVAAADPTRVTPGAGQTAGGGQMA